MLDQIRQRSASWGVKVAFGIIILVFVFWGVGSYNNSGPGTVATVNGKPILMKDFQRELHAEEERFRAMAPDASSEDLKTLRLPEQVLSRLVTRALVEQEAKRLGVTVTPLEYAAYLHRQPTFQVDGKFSQERYEDFVKNQRQNIGDFEQNFMREMLMDKMQGYLTAAVSVSPEEARQRIGFEMEKRIMSYVLFPTDDYRDGITVTDDAIKAYYDGNQAQFAQPATLAISYVDVTPAAIAHTMEVSDAELEKAYNAGPLRYNTRQIHLVVPKDADEAAIAAMKADLEGVATELNAGVEFAEATKALAEKYPGAPMGESGMMEARRIPEELLGALAGLKKDEIGPIVNMDGVLVLAQMIATDPDWSLTEDEIKTALRDELAVEKAVLAFRDVQGQAEDLVAMGKPLAEIAKELKVAVKTTSPAPRDELQFVLNLRRPAQLALLEGAKGTLINAILETAEGFAIAELGDSQPAGVKPLDDVKDLIRDVLAQREAEKKAEEAARGVMAGFGQPNATDVPESCKDKVVTSEPFNRQGNVPVLGYARGLVDAVFSAPLDQWLKEPFATTKGAVIAMPVEILPINDEEWGKIEGRAMELILQSKRGQLMGSFIADLHKKAEVKVTIPEIFEQ